MTLAREISKSAKGCISIQPMYWHLFAWNGGKRVENSTGGEEVEAVSVAGSFRKLWGRRERVVGVCGTGRVLPEVVRK